MGLSAVKGAGIKLVYLMFKILMLQVKTIEKHLFLVLSRWDVACCWRGCMQQQTLVWRSCADLQLVRRYLRLVLAAHSCRADEDVQKLPFHL